MPILETVVSTFGGPIGINGAPTVLRQHRKNFDGKKKQNKKSYSANHNNMISRPKTYIYSIKHTHQ